MCCMRLEKVKWRVAMNVDLLQKGSGDGRNQVALGFHVIRLFFTKITDIAFSTVRLHTTQRKVCVLQLKTTEIQQHSFATNCNKVSSHVCQMQHTGRLYMQQDRVR
jgi:hypothetical protein